MSNQRIEAGTPLQQINSGLVGTVQTQGIVGTPTSGARDASDAFSHGDTTAQMAAMAHQPPVPQTPAPRAASLRSGAESLREVANGPQVGVGQAVMLATAEGEKTSKDDDARHHEAEDADIQKSVRASHLHTDTLQISQGRLHTLQKAGVMEGASPAERLALMHREGGGTQTNLGQAVRETFLKAAQAASTGPEGFALPRRDVQG